MTVAVAAVLGLIVGHLLALFLDHSYSDRPLLVASWRCSRCRASLTPRHVMPLAGYLATGGRCHCGQWLPARYAVLPLAAAAVFAVATVVFQQWSTIVLSGLFGAVFLALLFTDLERRLLPNRLVYPALALAAAVSWLWPDRGADAAFLGGGLALGVTLALYILSRGGFGAGDVKMALLIGLVVGYPAVVVGGFVAAFSAGAIAAVLLLTRVVHRRQFIPYGPFLALGGLVALFWHLAE